jgi:ABC-2 type transport system ATP-binding protein
MTAPPDTAIFAEGLVKHYGDVKALDGLDLVVPRGAVFGLLGPNGAGKTTAVRILTTLLRPDSGQATVAGFDVRKHPDDVRRSIGLTGQFTAIDEYLTGRENLDMVGRLYHLAPPYVAAKADELLERFELTDAADRITKTYSGGMRRRLDLAASLIAVPEILFLDEPTTGLDPRSRIQMWEVIEGLVVDGTTVLLTTQYLEEADKLAREVVVVDRGRVIAKGTPDDLKTQVGGDRLQVVLRDRSQTEAASLAMGKVSTGDVEVDGVTLTAPVAGGSLVLVDAVRELDSAGVAISDITLGRPTLDDVFLTLTGHSAEDEAPPAGKRGRGRSKTRTKKGS